jgi:hypothetical protein
MQNDTSRQGRKPMPGSHVTQLPDLDLSRWHHSYWVTKGWFNLRLVQVTSHPSSLSVPSNLVPELDKSCHISWESLTKLFGLIPFLANFRSFPLSILFLTSQDRLWQGVPSQSWKA